MLDGCPRKQLMFTAAPVLIAVCLVACGQSKTTFEADTWPTCDSAIPIKPDATCTPLPSITSTTPACVGLFVGMLDRYSLSSGWPVRSFERDGIWFNQREYLFELGEPITVTTAVLVLGPGQMGVGATFPPRDFDMEIVDQHGHSVPLTEEGERLFARSVLSLKGYVIDQNTPFLTTFRIDEWFDLSQPGTYTMTLTRVRQGPPSEITGNSVVFIIQEPRP